MKDIFNVHHRFSIRKYSFGAASVLLGTVFLAQSQVAQAEVETSELSASSSLEENTSVPETSTSIPSTTDQISSPQTATHPVSASADTENALVVKDV